MQKALVDVSVLLIFFSRPEQFGKVFEQVKKARPSRLFLYQDGARHGREDDILGIETCRKIAEDIDWECEVYKFYQEENMGCDPSEYIAQKWAFSHTDKCIVLEDDDVPSISFFSFCKAMLDRYENDSRVFMICGLNKDEETTNIDGDYFFSRCPHIWGWASWRRVIDMWDGQYTFLDNKIQKSELNSLIKNRKYMSNLLAMCEKHKKSGKEYYESILLSNFYLNHGLAIHPRKNMINNIGVTANSTHFSGGINELPRGLRRVFTMKRFEIDIENLVHPMYMIENVDYKERSYRISGWGHPMVKLYRTLETMTYKIAHGDIKAAYSEVSGKVKKILKGMSY